LIPTLKSSLTTNEATALEFSTRRAVVADVVPDPLTVNLEVNVGAVVPCPTPTLPLIIHKSP
jgi:hypothetical protein